MKKNQLYALLFVVGTLVGVGGLWWYQSFQNTITDRSEIFSEVIHALVRPRNVDELKQIVTSATKPISVAGARYSQGGQIAYPHGIVIDMSSLNKVIDLDTKNKRITIQAGATWRSIQEQIDPHNLSIKVMQSYDDFSVGGSLSVNVHARDMGYGSLLSTVESITILLADGSLVKADRSTNSDLFFAAIGGYGLMGVIVNVTLSLTDNVRLERWVQLIDAEDYPDVFKRLSKDTSVIFQNADLFPMDFEKALSITWRQTNKPVTIKDRIQNGDAFQYLPKKAFEVLVRRIPIFRKVRPLIESVKGLQKTIVWRNYEMSYSIKQLAMTLHYPTTMTLQEYFVPVDKYEEALDALKSVLNHYSVNVINLSVRYVPQDTEALLSYAPQDSFAFVLYINMLNTDLSKEYLCNWTRNLTDKIIALGGTYYLPYIICADKEQFKQAYPAWKKFAKIKDTYDPQHLFKNMLWKKYFE